MVVCERHFDSRFIIRNYTYHHADGSEFTCPRDAPILDVDAVPTIFPNTPSYLSSPLPPKRKAPDSQRAEMAAVRCASKQFLVVNTLCCEVYNFDLCCLALDNLHIFDTVHIMKCIRNNWPNQKDSVQTFTYPIPLPVIGKPVSERIVTNGHEQPTQAQRFMPLVVPVVVNDIVLPLGMVM